jgi:hypothetical protein
VRFTWGSLMLIRAVRSSSPEVTPYIGTPRPRDGNGRITDHCDKSQLGPVRFHSWLQRISPFRVGASDAATGHRALSIFPTAHLGPYRRPTTQRSISTTAAAHATMSTGTPAASASPAPSSAGPIANKSSARRPAPPMNAGLGKSSIDRPFVRLVLKESKSAGRVDKIK